MAGQKLLAVGLALAGCIILLSALVTMLRIGTTTDPINPHRASKLVTKGIFGLSRNPIYLALWIMLVAWIIWWGNLFSVLLGITFIWYMNRFQIKMEESSLEQKFGDQFRNYKRQVRRWI